MRSTEPGTLAGSETLRKGRNSPGSSAIFEIGLETDMDALLRLGLPALWVAMVGVAVPFAGGFFLMRAFDVAVAEADDA